MSFTLDSILKERLEGSEQSNNVCRVDFGLIYAEIKGPPMNDGRFRRGGGGGGGEVESTLPVCGMAANLHCLKIEMQQKLRVDKDWP